MTYSTYSVAEAKRDLDLANNGYLVERYMTAQQARVFHSLVRRSQDPRTTARPVYYVAGRFFTEAGLACARREVDLV